MGDSSCPNCRALLPDFHAPGFCSACGARLLPTGATPKNFDVPHVVTLLITAMGVGAVKAFGWGIGIALWLLSMILVYVVVGVIKGAQKATPIAVEKVRHAGSKLADNGLLGVAQSASQSGRRTLDSFRKSYINPILYGRKGKQR